MIGADSCSVKAGARILELGEIGEVGEVGEVVAELGEKEAPPKAMLPPSEAAAGPGGASGGAPLSDSTLSTRAFIEEVRVGTAELPFIYLTTPPLLPLPSRPPPPTPTRPT